MAVGDRNIAVTLTVNAAGYVTGMNQAARSAQQTEAATKRVGSTVDKTKSSLISFKNIALYAFGYGVATGVVKMAKAAVNSLMDFEDAIANLGAASMASSGDLDKMREAALKAGQDTQFTATEAADAMTELAKAGVSTADILGGALGGALNLAAAGSVDVAFAAETAATAMVQFGLSGKDMNHVADLLAAGAGKAQGGVKELALALRQGGQVAAMVGWDFENTTTALTAFAAAGLLGSDAGTSLKTMLLRLANPANKASEVMSQYGLSVYDSTGKMVGAAELAGRLTAAFGDLEPQARNAALGIIFGTDAVRGANVLYSQGRSGIEQWGEAVNDAGYAAKVAAEKNDTLRGDLNKLRGTMDALINGQGAGIIDMFRQIAQGADEALKQTDVTMNDIDDVVQDTLGTWSYDDKPLIDPDVGAFDLIGQAAGDLGQQIAEAVDTILLLPLRLNQEVYPSLYQGERAMDAWGARLSGAAAAALDADSASEELATGLDGVEKSADDAAAEIDALVEAIEGLGGQFLTTQELQDNLTGAINDARTPFEDLKSATDNLAEAKDDLARADSEAARESAAEAVARAEAEVVAAQAAVTLDGNTDAALDNRAALRKIAEQAKASAANMAAFENDTSGAERELWRAREALIQTAVNMGYTRGQAEDLADEMGLIPGSVSTQVSAPGLDSNLRSLASYNELLRNLPAYKRTEIQQHYYTTGERVAGITGAGGHTFARGGWADAKGYASAGWVSGPGTSTSDSIPAWLSRGEFVVNAASASHYGPLLEAINAGKQVGGSAGGGVTVNVSGTSEQIVQQVTQRLRYEQALARTVV